MSDEGAPCGVDGCTEKFCEQEAWEEHCKVEHPEYYLEEEGRKVTEKENKNKMSDSQTCPDFVFKNPHPEYRCKKGHYCSPSLCVMCVSMYDQTFVKEETKL